MQAIKSRTFTILLSVQRNAQTLTHTQDRKQTDKTQRTAHTTCVTAETLLVATL